MDANFILWWISLSKDKKKSLTTRQTLENRTLSLFLNICPICSVSINSVPGFPIGKNCVRLGSIQQKATEFRDLTELESFRQQVLQNHD